MARLNRAYCCVPQCKNGAWKCPDLSFHRFPEVKESWPKAKKDVALKKRQAWIHALKIGKEISNRMVVCSAHFKTSDYILPDVPTQRRRLKVNAIPTQNLPLSSVESIEQRDIKEKHAVVRKKRYEKIARKREASTNSSISEVPERANEEDCRCPTVPTADEMSVAEVLLNLSTTANDDVGGSASPQFLDKAIQVCSGDLGSRVQLQIENLTNKQLNSLTGIHSTQILDHIVHLLASITKPTAKFSLTPKQSIILTFMKIKLNLSFQVLSILFGITATTCSNYFIRNIHDLAVVFKPLINWPSKEEILANMPICFNKFPKVRLVLDCTEIPLGAPKCLRCRILAYSTYKGQMTMKYMIGVSPAGLITYVSRGYGGRASDHVITEQSNVLSMLEPHIDSVMVDKGFQIQKLCEDKFVDFICPPFLKDKKALSISEAISTKEIASARVHVERAIQRIKTFKMLAAGKFPWKFIGLADEIMTIACGIVNLGSPILADERF